jgi:hypothetical protein
MTRSGPHPKRRNPPNRSLRNETRLRTEEGRLLRGEGAILAKISLSPPRPHVAQVDGVGIFVCGELGQARAEAGPVLGDNDGVLRIAGLAADGAGETGADLGEIDHAGHVGNVLRALVVDAAIAVAEEQHGEGAAVRCFNFAKVEQHAVEDAAGLDQKQAARSLQLLGRGAFAKDQPRGERCHGAEGYKAYSDLPWINAAQGHGLAGHFHCGPK